MIVAVVVSPGVLVEIALQPLLRDRVVDAADAILSQRPEPLNGLCVRVAVDVDAVLVADAMMPIPAS